MEGYLRIPPRDLDVLIQYYTDKESAQNSRRAIPSIPKNIHKFTRHFINNSSCVNGVIPHSPDHSLKKGNLYNGMATQLGMPDFCVSSNPSSKEKKIVLHLITGETFEFEDKTFDGLVDHIRAEDFGNA